MKASRDILTLFEQLSSHEVFTPPGVARDMLALLPKAIWTDPNVRILDPCVKSGVFLREAMYLLMDGLAGKGLHVGHDGNTYNLDNGRQRMSHILKNMLFGIATSELTGYIARRTLYGVMEANTDKQIALLNALEKHRGFASMTEKEKDAFIDRNIVNEYYDHTLFNVPEYAGYEHEGNIFYPRDEINEKAKLLDDYSIEDTSYPFIHETQKHLKIENIRSGAMKFDVVIGNPPYQISDGGSGNGISAKPIFHQFVLSAFKISPKHVCMIIPSRWFAGGKGLNDFREQMLANRGIKKIVDFSNSKDCFPGVNIAGGVNYFLWTKSHQGPCEIVNMSSGNHSTCVRDIGAFDVFIRDNIAVNIISDMRKKRTQFLSDQVLTRNPFGFESKVRGSDVGSDQHVKLFHSQGFGFVPRSEVLKNRDVIDKFKVTIGKVVPSNGEVDVTPEIGYRVITTPKIYEPGEIFTETYLLLGAFESRQQAENFQYYMTQKLPRYLMKQTLTSMNISKSNFDFVPMFDWSKKWSDADIVSELGISNADWQYVDSIMRPINLSEAS